jgi:hypothetical protein
MRLIGGLTGVNRSVNRVDLDPVDSGYLGVTVLHGVAQNRIYPRIYPQTVYYQHPQSLFVGRLLTVLVGHHMTPFYSGYLSVSVLYTGVYAGFTSRLYSV